MDISNDTYDLDPLSDKEKQESIDDAIEEIKAHTAPMDHLRKAEWLSALRSGHFRQTRSILKSDTNEYCCLGVLCEINNLRQVRQGNYNFYITVPPSDLRHDELIFNRERGSCTELPKDFAEEIHLKHGLMNALTVLNDNGMTFAQIADVVEKYL